LKLDCSRFDLSISYCGQVKHYKKNSYVCAEDIRKSVYCLYILRDNGFLIDNVEFLTPEGVRLSKPKLNSNRIVHSIIDFSTVEKWIDKALDYIPEEPIVEYQIRKCQSEAREIIKQKWGESMRIRMICGSGKTDLICERIVVKKKLKFLILVPRIILLEQWLEILKDWNIEASGCGTGYKVDSESRVVVCVYNSFEKVMNLDWDYIIIDEAHHLENVEVENEEEEKTYRELIVLKTQEIPAIWLSATLEREVDYFYGLREAINDNVLVDYQIHIPVFSTKQYSLIDYLIEHPEFLSILAYCNSIVKAREFCQELIEAGFSADVITCEEKKNQRKKIFESFKNGQIQILVSVNVLGEGINLNNADACLFVDSRSSIYSIIQCIGRVLRLSPGKKMAHIVLPCVESVEEKETAKFINALAKADILLEEMIREKKFSHRIRIEGVEEKIDEKEGVKLYETIIDSSFKMLNYGDWRYKFDLLGEFRLKFGKLPTREEIYQHIPVGDWLHSQRDSLKQGKMLPEREKLLDDLDKSWRCSEVTKEEKWLETLELLADFIEKHNRLPQYKEEYKDVNIGPWLGNQKQKFKTGKLSDERINLLDQVDPNWKPLSKEKRVSRGWSENCGVLVEFVKENGRLPQYREVYCENAIGTWLWTQKQDFKDGKMSVERIRLLDRIDPAWKPLTTEKRIFRSWSENYEVLTLFVEEKGRLPECREEYMDFPVGTWLGNQRRYFKTGKMSSDKIELLDQIDKCWKIGITEKNEENWVNTLEYCYQFYLENKRLPKCREKYEGVNVGYWLSDQKKNFKNGKLSLERIEWLDQIDPSWKKDL
jgi:superfamily II DNA or RNA helicase